jgi:hypothetical protein
MDMVSFFKFFDMENFDFFFPQKLAKLVKFVTTQKKKTLPNLFVEK